MLSSTSDDAEGTTPEMVTPASTADSSPPVPDSPHKDTISPQSNFDFTSGSFVSAEENVGELLIEQLKAMF